MGCTPFQARKICIVRPHLKGPGKRVKGDKKESIWRAKRGGEYKRDNLKPIFCVKSLSFHGGWWKKDLKGLIRGGGVSEGAEGQGRENILDPWECSSLRKLGYYKGAED